MKRALVFAAYSLVVITVAHAQLAISDGGTGASTLAGAQTNLQIGPIAVQTPSAVAITGGSINGTNIGNTAPPSFIAGLYHSSIIPSGSIGSSWDKTNTPLLMANLLTGTPAASMAYGTNGPFQLVSVDGMTSTWGQPGIDTLSVRTQMQGPVMGVGGFTGLRTGINQKLSIDQAPMSNPGSGVSAAFVGGHFYTEASVPLGGGGTTFIDYLGSLFAMNPQVILGNNAGGYARITGAEFDISVGAPMTIPPAQSFGISIIHNLGHNTRATYDDAALLVADQGSIATKWKTGFQFGGYGSANWPLAADSTIIGAVARTYPTADSPVAKYGIDFSQVQFSPGGAAFTSTGFTVDPGGVVKSAFAIGTADPTTTDITAGLCEDWNNSMTGMMKRWCNVGGTLKSITYN